MVATAAPTKNGPMSLPVRRTRDHALVAGVCAGLARRWNVDANLLRIAVAILAFSSGLGLLLYGAAWLLIPVDGSTQAPARRLLPFTRDWPTPALVAATVAVGIVGFGVLGGWSGVGIFPLLVIAAVWYFGILRPRSQAHPPTAAEVTPYERAAQAWRLRLAEQQERGLGPAAGPGASPQPAITPPPMLVQQPTAHQPLVTTPLVTTPLAVTASETALRFFGDPVVEPGSAPVPVPMPTPRRWSLWWLSVGVVAVGASLVGVLQALGIGSGPLPYLAVLLVGLGVALLIATRRGRPRLMLATTVAAILATVAAMAVESGEVGLPSRQVVVSAAAELPERIEDELGDLSVDLSRLTSLDHDRSTTVDLTTGSLRLVLPADVNTEVTWAVEAGRFSGVDAGLAGVDLSGVDVATPHPGAPTLRLHVTVQAGNLEVTR